MKDIIESSIKNAGMSETEVAEWVVNLKSYHDEETKRREQREEDLAYQVEVHNLAVNNFKLAGEQLDAKAKALARLGVQLTKEREELRQVKQDLQRERQLLRETLKEFKPGRLTQFVVAFLAALSALVLFLVVLRLAPDVLRWIGALFN